MTEALPVPLVYWRRELPPLDLEVGAEHVCTARSAPVPYHYSERDALWGRCIDDLTARARERIAAEVARLGGVCAHVVDEEVEPKVDHQTETYCLEGRYTYVLYVRPGGGRGA